MAISTRPPVQEPEPPRFLDEVVLQLAADPVPVKVLAVPKDPQSVDDYETFTGHDLDRFVDATVKHLLAVGLSLVSRFQFRPSMSPKDPPFVKPKLPALDDMEAPCAAGTQSLRAQPCLADACLGETRAGRSVRTFWHCLCGDGFGFEPTGLQRADIVAATWTCRARTSCQTDELQHHHLQRLS